MQPNQNPSGRTCSVAANPRNTHGTAGKILDRTGTRHGSSQARTPTTAADLLFSTITTYSRDCFRCGAAVWESFCDVSLHGARGALGGVRAGVNRLRAVSSALSRSCTRYQSDVCRFIRLCFEMSGCQTDLLENVFSCQIFLISCLHFNLTASQGDWEHFG